MQQFGGISALTIFFSFISCVFILPTFLRIWASYREKRGTLRSDDKLLQKEEEREKGKEEKVDEEPKKAEPPKELKEESKPKSKSKSKSDD